MTLVRPVTRFPAGDSSLEHLIRQIVEAQLWNCGDQALQYWQLPSGDPQLPATIDPQRSFRCH
jgi:hypothetical protein